MHEATVLPTAVPVVTTRKKLAGLHHFMVRLTSKVASNIERCLKIKIDGAVCFCDKAAGGGGRGEAA